VLTPEELASFTAELQYLDDHIAELDRRIADLCRTLKPYDDQNKEIRDRLKGITFAGPAFVTTQVRWHGASDFSAKKRPSGKPRDPPLPFGYAEEVEVKNRKRDARGIEQRAVLFEKLNKLTDQWGAYAKDRRDLNDEMKRQTRRRDTVQRLLHKHQLDLEKQMAKKAKKEQEAQQQEEEAEQLDELRDVDAGYSQSFAITNKRGLKSKRWKW